jgi:hypothetical protein
MTSAIESKVMKICISLGVKMLSFIDNFPIDYGFSL